MKPLRFIALFALTAFPAFAQTETFKVGAKFSLIVTSDGNPAPTFEWFKDGVKIADGPTLVFASVTTNDAGSYTAKATNSEGFAMSEPPPFTLIVDDTAPPVFAMAPLDATVKEGSALTLAVIATGSPSPTYQWRKNGVDIPGATSPKLAFSAISRTDAGSYDAVATNPSGSVTSPAAVINVLYAPSAPIITRPLSNVTVLHKSDLALGIEFTSELPATIQWKKGTTILPGRTEPSLYLRDVTPANAGTYEVTVRSEGGSASSKAVVLVAKR